MQSILRELKAILEHVTGKAGLAERLSDTANVIDDVGLDSLEMMNFMLEIERRLAVDIDFDKLDFDAMRSLSVLAGFLAKVRQAR